jgi:hypothetical protein
LEGRGGGGGGQVSGGELHVRLHTGKVAGDGSGKQSARAAAQPSNPKASRLRPRPPRRTLMSCSQFV